MPHTPRDTRDQWTREDFYQSLKLAKHKRDGNLHPSEDGELFLLEQAIYNHLAWYDPDHFAIEVEPNVFYTIILDRDKKTYSVHYCVVIKIAQIRSTIGSDLET